MRRIICAAIALCLTSASGCAPTAADRVQGPAAAARFTLDTPLEVLAANGRARAVLKRDVPGLFRHPSYALFKGMSLRQLQPYSPEAMPPALMTRVEADLAAIK